MLTNFSTSRCSQGFRSNWSVISATMVIICYDTAKSVSIWQIMLSSVGCSLITPRATLTGHQFIIRYVDEHKGYCIALDCQSWSIGDVGQCSGNMETNGYSLLQSTKKFLLVESC
ncbi:hypothetical protein ACOSP7_004029 [Xanthoceras sorbifolium]